MKAHTPENIHTEIYLHRVLIVQCGKIIKFLEF